MTRIVRAATLALLLAGIALTSGCQRPPGTSGAAVERDGQSGPLRYRVASRLTPRRATLGDPVHWTLRAELPDSARPVALLADSSQPSLDVSPIPAPRRRGTGDRAEWTWGATVRGFDLGAIPLPPVRLALAVGATPDTIAFPLDTLAVDSLTQTASVEPAPDRGPVATELRPIDYALAGLLLVLLAAAAFLAVRAIRLARARNRAAASAREAPDPPAVVLRRELEALRRDGGALPRDRFYDRLSIAVRDYAAAVTGIAARDRTTTELVRELEALGDVPRAAVEAVARALDRADLARFARRGDAWEEALRTIEEAGRLPERLPDRSATAEAPASRDATAPGHGAAGSPRAGKG